jgi:antitoxin (DNA-binding transcriptional repressor) of toxin-antitoxin stability system
MSTYTVAEAEIRLSELIDRALNGEGVVIIRDDRSSVALKVVSRRPQRRRDTQISEGERDLLHVLRELPASVKNAAAAEIRQMREEGEA